MNQTTDSTHVTKLIPDFVLGLLPGDEAAWVAAHAAHCGQCRQALAQEQGVGRTVKATLSRVTATDKDRVRQLMPKAPVSSGVRSGWPFPSPALAAAAVVLVVLFSAAALFVSQRPGAWKLSAPTARSTTVMLTDTPTQTATREVTATAEGLEANAGPVLGRRSQSASPASAPVPVPALAPVPAAPLLP